MSTTIDEYRLLLDRYYHEVKETILHHQSPTTGLLVSRLEVGNAPVLKDANRAGRVRDNVLSIMSVWALALGYRRLDYDQGRACELEQCVVKCMRGLLFCMMRQADKVEKFKLQQSESSSLHAMYDVISGDVILGDQEWNHLQLDATALFILQLAQLIASGLQLIYTVEEAAFVQNLVFYIERAYRTPDFGMWEHGSTMDPQQTELHASSIGMAKAALEAINGLDVFAITGVKNVGASATTIHVDPDAHHRNCSILDSLIPRESRSKETDASLLSVCGFPSFAIADPVKSEATRSKVLSKLKGEYGCIRFAGDKFGRAPATTEPNPNEEIRECQWPVFFVYLAIDAFFRNDTQQAHAYMDKLETLSIIVNGYHVLPQLYCYSPSTQQYTVDQQTPLLWAHSLWLVARMLQSSVVYSGELDPLCLRVTGSLHSQNNLSNLQIRNSSFRLGTRSDLVVQVALIAENERLQAFLSTYGMVTQTLAEIEPIQLCSASFLMKISQNMGASKRLHLTGRPPRPLGSLSTSKVYMLKDRPFVFYPIIFDQYDFYMSFDDLLLIDSIRAQLTFIRNSWSLLGRPLVCLIMKERIMKSKHQVELISLMASLKKGVCDGVFVHLGRLQQMIATSCQEHLDFVSLADIASPPSPFHQSAPIPLPKRQSTFFDPKQMTIDRSAPIISTKTEIEMQQEAEKAEATLAEISDDALRTRLNDCANTYETAAVLLKLLERGGMDGATGLRDFPTVRSLLTLTYDRACHSLQWSVVRLLAGVQRKLVDSLAPSITDILVRGKEVSLGIFGRMEIVISEPKSPAFIQDAIYQACEGYPRHCVLQQEILIFLGELIVLNPSAFSGMLRVRVGWIVEAMQSEFAANSNRSRLTADTMFWHVSPFEMKALLRQVMHIHTHTSGEQTLPEPSARFNKFRAKRASKVVAKDSIWFRRRRLDGSLNRTPPNFYTKVWHVLMKCPGGLAFESQQMHIASFRNMVPGDRNFALRVEDLLNTITHPEVRQITVELLMIIAIILERNPEVEFHQLIRLDTVIQEAAILLAQETEDDEGGSLRSSNSSPMIPNVVGSLVLSAKTGLLRIPSPSRVAQLNESDFDININHGSGLKRSNTRVYEDTEALNVVGTQRLNALISQPPGGHRGSTTYLAKAVVHFLQYGVEVGDCASGDCAIS